MSFLANLFGAAPTTNAPPQPQTPGGNPTQVNQPGQQLPGTHASATTAPNGMIPAAGATQQPAPGQEPNKPASPLDGFGDIWNTVKTEGADLNAPMFAGLDANKVMESARKVDFSRAVTPEQMQKIAGGGQDAVTAFAAAMNSVAQTVYAQSAMATTKIVEQALGTQQERYNANLPSMVKKLSVNEGIQASNPLLTNPAVQPLVSALSEQLTRKNPNASSAEIQQQIGDYFSALGGAFAPKAPETAESRQAARLAASATDWDEFLK